MITTTSWQSWPVWPLQLADKSLAHPSRPTLALRLSPVSNGADKASKKKHNPHAVPTDTASRRLHWRSGLQFIPTSFQFPKLTLLPTLFKTEKTWEEWLWRLKRRINQVDTATFKMTSPAGCCEKDFTKSRWKWSSFTTRSECGKHRLTQSFTALFIQGIVRHSSLIEERSVYHS